jgi:hypothetical protein
LQHKPVVVNNYLGLSFAKQARIGFSDVAHGLQGAEKPLKTVSRRKEITFTTCLGLLPSSFVERWLQIHADMRLACASLADKIPAASCPAEEWDTENAP